MVPSVCRMKLPLYEKKAPQHLLERYCKDFVREQVRSYRASQRRLPRPHNTLSDFIAVAAGETQIRKPDFPYMEKGWITDKYHCVWWIPGRSESEINVDRDASGRVVRLSYSPTPCAACAYYWDRGTVYKRVHIKPTGITTDTSCDTCEEKRANGESMCQCYAHRDGRWSECARYTEY